MSDPFKLVLIDYHPLVPFIVRSHQFTSRAAAFAQQAPNNLDVEIWLPAPEVSQKTLRKRIGLPIPVNLVHFGPPRTRNILGRKLTLTVLFSNWVRRELAKLAKTSRPIAYFRTLKLAAAMAPHLKKLGIPWIFETHEIFSKTARYPQKIKPLESFVYREADIVVSISRSLSDDLANEFSLECPALLPSGHNNALSDIPDYNPASPPRFLYIGSLHQWKGIEPFLIATRDLEIPTDIVGDAGGLQRLNVFVGRQNLKHVILHGHKDPEHLKSFYGTGTICVLPLSEAAIAQRYTSPLKLFEYASAGRPVMIGTADTISSIPGIQRAVYLVDGDWNAATKALLSNTRERQRLSKAAREFANGYTWTENAKKLFNNPNFRELLS